MEQLFFLSIVFNGLAGFLFLFGDFGESPAAEEGRKFFFFGNGFRLIIGILTGVTGILKVFIPFASRGDRSVYFLGDLLPAAAGICAGFMLVYGFYRERAANVDGEEKINRFGEVILHYHKAAGIALLAVATLHFLFPGALFL